MTQPRKEQIKDLTTRFTPLTGADAAILGLGNAQQVFQDPTYYTAFLGSTVTGLPGGAEASASAFLQSGTKGPFSVSAGAQISVTLPGVNAGNPIIVTFQAGDIVVLGGVSVLTTSHAVDRINSTLSSSGVTYAVASNSDGYLRLQSAAGAAATVGDAASITLKDVTAGTLATLGFGAVASVTATGTTAPKRGIVTVTPDGLGGEVPLRSSDGSPCTTQPSKRFNHGGTISFPDVTPGYKIFGRLTYQPSASPTPTVTLAYKYSGYVQPTLVTHAGNLTSLSGVDTVTVVLSDSTLPAPYATVTIPVTFGTPPTTAADVAAAFNTAYHTVTEALGTSVGAGRAVVTSATAGPYSFSPLGGLGDSFNITVDGTGPVPLQFYGTMTVAQLVTQLNTMLNPLASATSRTDANGNTILSISTASAAGSSSTIVLAPGINGDTKALDKLGLAAGTYTGGTICSVYGNDEVKFVNPSKSQGAQLTISGASSSLIKLGFLSGLTQTASATQSEAPATFPPSVLALAVIPEVLEFGEIPDAYEDGIQKFLAPARPAAPTASAGLANLGLPPALGPDGKIDPAFAAKILDVMNVDGLVVGTRQAGSAAALSTPRILSAVDSSKSAFLLLADIPDVAATAAHVRVYLRSGPVLGGITSQSIVVTTNAQWSTSGLDWTSDVSTAEASYMQLGPDGRAHYKYLRTPGGAFSDSSWIDVIQTDPTGSAGAATAILGLGTGGPAEVARGDNLIPRISTPSASDGTSFTLVWYASNGLLGPHYRMYVQSGGTGTGVYLTNNAYWNGTAWNKDSVSGAANAIQLDGDNLKVFARLPVNAGSWTSWDETLVQMTGTTNSTTFSGGTNIASTQASFAGGAILKSHTGVGPILQLTPAGDIPPTTSPVTNAIYGKNLVRAWARVRQGAPGGGGSISSWVVEDGFNVSNATYDAGAGCFRIDFATLVWPTYCTLSGMSAVIVGGGPDFQCTQASSWTAWNAAGSKNITGGVVCFGQTQTSMYFYPQEWPGTFAGSWSLATESVCYIAIIGGSQ